MPHTQPSWFSPSHHTAPRAKYGLESPELQQADAVIPCNVLARKSKVIRRESGRPQDKQNFNLKNRKYA